MKFLRFLFGRFFLVFLLAVAQAAAFVALFIYVRQALPYYFFANILVGIFAVLVTIRLVNKGCNPDHIIPWLVLILMVPLAGIPIYFLLSRNRLSKRQRRLYESINSAIGKQLNQDETIFEYLWERDRLVFSQVDYLANASGLPVYDDVDTRYLPSGEEFFEVLMQELLLAKRFIFLQFFIIERGKMLERLLELLIQKVEEGLEVRLMYDDIGSIATLPMNFHKKMRSFGIKCVKFSRFLPFASAVHNNRNHRKFAIIDGSTAIVTGANLADEYINAKKRCPYFKDSAVFLKGAAVKNLTALFLIGYSTQTKRVEDYSYYFTNFDFSAPVKPSKKEKEKDRSRQEKGFVLPFGDGPRPIYDERVSQNTILNMINQAKNYVYITTPYLIVDYRLSEAIKSAGKRGVDVRIVTPKIPDKRLVFLVTRSSFASFIKSGVKIYEFTPGFMHSKNILVDGEVAIVGSINLDYRSLVHHFECGVFLINTPCIADIATDFDQIFALSHELSLKESQLNLFKRMVKSVLQLFAPLL